MTDKRSESERVSARAPVPSLAPPTDEIDSEWGVDDIPPAPRLPQTAAPAPAQPPAASLATPIKTPVPRGSVPPRPTSSPSATETPLATASTRPSAISTPLVAASTPPSALTTPLINAPAAAPGAGTPLVVTSDPRRKQTLLGIAPVIAPRSEPSADAPPAVAEPGSDPPAVARENLAPAPLTSPAGQNPLRKHTLLGLAPGLPATQAAPATPDASAAATSVAGIATPAVIATDAPTARDVLPPVDAREPRPAVRAITTPSGHDDDLPELKPKRSRVPWGLGVAAAIALGVIGLRQLDRAPTAVPAELARPVNAAKPAAKAVTATPTSDDHGDAATPGADDQPTPLSPELTPAGGEAKGAAAAPSASSTTPPGATVQIKISSDPPGARLFWKGKQQGTTPFVLEFPAGERHSYELGLPGYSTRKVVLDGSKTDINIGMRRVAGPASGGSR